jgi:beta-glucosidase
VRWSGFLKPPVTGTYSLAVAPVSDGRTAARLFLENKAIASGGSALLKAGQSYPIRIEYPSPGVSGSVQLTWLPPQEPLLAEALDTIRSSDVAVVFAGLNPNLEGEEMRVSVPGFKGGDRTDLKLPETQENLLAAAFATGKPVIVVLTSGSALAVNNAADHANAILQLWYGGEEAGTAIAETLAGVNNPAGRLPVTFYKSSDELPPFDDYSMEGRTYRYFKGQALYGFGFGLSYSTFRYSGARAKRTATGATISVRVRNSSLREGDEVAQLYLEGPGLASGALRELKGFQRVHLKAGESRELTFTLNPSELPKEKVAFTAGGGQAGPDVSSVRGTL